MILDRPLSNSAGFTLLKTPITAIPAMPTPAAIFMFFVSSVKDHETRGTDSTHKRCVYHAHPGTTFEIIGSSIENKTTGRG